MNRRFVSVAIVSAIWSVVSALRAANYSFHFASFWRVKSCALRIVRKWRKMIWRFPILFDTRTLIFEWFWIFHFLSKVETIRKWVSKIGAINYLPHGLHRCTDIVDEVFLRHLFANVAITSQVVFRSIYQLGGWRYNLYLSIRIHVPVRLPIVYFLAFLWSSIVMKQKLAVRTVTTDELIKNYISW